MLLNHDTASILEDTSGGGILKTEIGRIKTTQLAGALPNYKDDKKFIIISFSSGSCRMLGFLHLS